MGLSCGRSLQAPPPHPAGERRILVVANETVAGQALLSEIRRRSEVAPSTFMVVCPALNSHVKHWTSDEDEARAQAEERLERSLAALHGVGIDARGEIGDDDPLQAIEDALRTFAPDELIISTHPEGKSNWLERGVVVRGARALRDAGDARRRRPRRRTRLRIRLVSARLSAPEAQPAGATTLQFATPAHLAT